MTNLGPYVIPESQDPKLLHYLDGYRIIRHGHTPFASGGFCDVFIGDHQVYGKVAMRRPRMTEKGYTLGEMENFFDESKIWKKLRHPNILQFLGLIQSDGYIWAVSRFAEHGSLIGYLRDHPKTERHPLLLQLADAVRYLHREGVVHGDIKGSNILVSTSDTILLCDFGLSKLSDTHTSPSMEGAASSRWCAPEVLLGETKTFASDVYSFAMTIYELLTGRVPFYDLANEVLVIRAINDGLRPPRGPAASESGDLDDIWDIVVDGWNENASSRPNMEIICERLGLPATSLAGTATEEGSIDERMEPHSLASTSSGLTKDAEPEFSQLRIANRSGHPSMTRQYNMDKEGMIVNPSTVVPTRTELRTEEAYRKKQEDEMLILRIPRAHARYDDTSTKPSRACHHGTRVTLLQIIRDWINGDSSTNPFFWLCGEVGVGKTTIAHTISMEQDELRQLGASFFFTRDSDQRRHPTLFATTIAYQLARFDALAHQAVADALRPDPDLVRRDLKKQVQQLVVQSLDCIGKSSCRRVVIVIDGLDECSDPVSLLDVLPLLAQHTGLRLRILVTSRPHAAIVTKFQSTRLCHLTNETQFRNINSRTLNGDVRAYLEWTLGEIASEYGLPSPWPLPRQVNQLVDLSNGLFVIASVFDRYIRDPVEGDPEEQLARILSRRKAVGSSPTAELDLMYDLVLEDLQRSLSEKDVGFARNLLQLTFLSSERISISEMSEALGRAIPDVRSVSRRMTSVIILPKANSGYITPFHASFGEYINDPERCSITEFLIEPVSSHAEVASIFLEIFICAAEAGITGIEYDFNNPPPMKLQIADRELRYHLSSATGPAPTQLQHAKDRFCQNGIRTWMFVWHWSSYDMNDNDLLKYIKEARYASACDLDDEASLQHSMVEHILNHIRHLSVRCSSPLGGRDEAGYAGSHVVNNALSETFTIKLRWESTGWTISNGDPRYFARLLWRWSKFEHRNIVPLKGIDIQSLPPLSEQSAIFVPLTSHYPDLKRNWYPLLMQAFKQNSEEAIQTVLGIAHSLRYLLENGFYGSSLWLNDSYFSIEDVVLSEEKAMIHPLFLVYKDSVHPSSTVTGRQHLAKHGFTHWHPHGRGAAPRIVWDFGCVIYEMMTGKPPLKHYHDLVMESGSADHEPMDSDAPLEDYRDLVKRSGLSDFTILQYWLSPTPKKSDSTVTKEEIRRHRYQTAVHHLLDDLQVSKDLKDVLGACWVVNVKERPSIQELVARLTAILKEVQT